MRRGVNVRPATCLRVEAFDLYDAHATIDHRRPNIERAQQVLALYECGFRNVVGAKSTIFA